MLENAEKYGFDLDHVFFVGDSAGANNLGIYSALCTNEKYAAEFDFEIPKGFKPTAIALNCGAFEIDMNNPDPTDLTVMLMGDLMPEKGSEKEMWLVNPINHVTGNYPPTFFMTCTADFLKDQAPIMASKLAECNVPFIYRYYVSKTEDLPHVFHCNMKSDDARLCNDEECEFFKKFL